MSIHSIQPFNALSPYQGTNRQKHIEIQETIYYGESRFRQILTAISNAAPDLHKIFQQKLHQELVSHFLLLPLQRLTYVSSLSWPLSVLLVLPAK